MPSFRVLNSVIGLKNIKIPLCVLEKLMRHNELTYVKLLSIMKSRVHCVFGIEPLTSLLLKKSMIEKLKLQA